MTKKTEAHEAGARASEARIGRSTMGRGPRKPNARRDRVVYAAGMTLMVAAPFAAALLLAGCGGSGSSSKASESHADAVTSQPAEPAVAVAAMSGGSTVGAETGSALARPEGLPPDVVVSLQDTLVVPGEPIEIAVDATSDVTEIALSDGTGDPQAFVRDTTGGVWRASYRVPLKPRQERFGLSVTAKNEAHRWRRVWVFLHVQPTEAEQVRAEESRVPEDTSDR